MISEGCVELEVDMKLDKEDNCRTLNTIFFYFILNAAFFIYFLVQLPQNLFFENSRLKQKKIQDFF